MTSENRRNTINIVIRANNELIDKKNKLNTIRTMHLKSILSKLELKLALKEVISSETQLLEDIEKLRKTISERTRLLLNNYWFGEVIEKKGKLYAQKGTVTKTPITHFTINDVNRGYTIINRILIDFKKEEVVGTQPLRFYIRTGALIPAKLDEY